MTARRVVIQWPASDDFVPLALNHVEQAARLHRAGLVAVTVELPEGMAWRAFRPWRLKAPLVCSSSVGDAPSLATVNLFAEDRKALERTLYKVRRSPEPDDKVRPAACWGCGSLGACTPLAPPEPPSPEPDDYERRERWLDEGRGTNGRGRPHPCTRDEHCAVCTKRKKAAALTYSYRLRRLEQKEQARQADAAARHAAQVQAAIDSGAITVAIVSFGAYAQTPNGVPILARAPECLKRLRDLADGRGHVGVVVTKGMRWPTIANGWPGYSVTLQASNARWRGPVTTACADTIERVIATWARTPAPTPAPATPPPAPIPPKPRKTRKTRKRKVPTECVGLPEAECCYRCRNRLRSRASMRRRRGLDGEGQRRRLATRAA